MFSHPKKSNSTERQATIAFNDSVGVSEEPSPSPSSRSTITVKPIATPTKQPGPVSEIPDMAIIPDDWPTLPATLYFLRSGALWRWPAGGDPPKEIIAAPSSGTEACGVLCRPYEPLPQGVLDYRVTPDEQNIAFLYNEIIRLEDGSQSSGASLRVLNRTTGEVFTLQTTGILTMPYTVNIPYRFNSSFEITPDGRYVIYVAWGVQTEPGAQTTDATPATDLLYGPIYAIDVQNPGQPIELAHCSAYADQNLQINCEGFVLSPDGTQIAFTDGAGLWISKVPEGIPSLQSAHETESGVAILHVRNGSPDEQWLMLEVSYYEGSDVAIMDLSTKETYTIPHTNLYGGIDFPFLGDSVWGRDGSYVLSSFVSTNPKSDYSSVYLRQIPLENPESEIMIIAEEGTAPIFVTNLHDFADGRIGFMNQRCIDSEELPSGIYAIAGPQSEEEGNNLEMLLPLPQAACYTNKEYSNYGDILWAPNGKTFLYMTWQAETWQPRLMSDAWRPTLLGRLDEPSLWDVRDLLQGTRNFHWQPALSPEN